MFAHSTSIDSQRPSPFVFKLHLKAAREANAVDQTLSPSFYEDTRLTGQQSTANVQLLRRKFFHYPVALPIQYAKLITHNPFDLELARSWRSIRIHVARLSLISDLNDRFLESSIRCSTIVVISCFVVQKLLYVIGTVKYLTFHLVIT